MIIEENDEYVVFKCNGKDCEATLELECSSYEELVTSGQAEGWFIADADSEDCFDYCPEHNQFNTDFE